MLMVGHILQLEGYEALREAFPIPTIEVVYYIQKPVEEDLARRLKHSRLPATEVDNQHVTNIDNRRPIIMTSLNYYHFLTLLLGLPEISYVVIDSTVVKNSLAFSGLDTDRATKSRRKLRSCVFFYN
jgi:hypothetical protein